MKPLNLFTTFTVSVLLVACAEEPGELQVGANPTLPAPSRGLLPTMKIPQPVGWEDRMPTVPDGYTITAIATDLKIPRQTLILPNGDILVAEGRGGNAPALKPKDVIAAYIKGKGTTSVESGNRITLLRDADGDGEYEFRSVFAADLNAPYGLAFIDNRIYVANQDALVWFDYEEGQTEASGAPQTLTELPSEINHHWTKAMTASADGRHLYVGIGSNSNITERGMTAEADRAVVWQVDVETGAHRTYASGLRNPTALAIQPGSGQLWAVVNERDEIGPDLVPDYLTRVQDGAFYGWPYAFWGPNADDRVRPQKPEKVVATIAPDYALGSHVAALGVDFSNEAMGQAFADGVFVGMHGSWNRAHPVGYKVVFVPFTNGAPAGPPIDVVTGFLDAENNTTRGRPVGVTVDPRGALIVADDLSNAIWRIVPDAAG
ncbi:MAG TPA: sorbosone dehydrogenase family protein [Burkholderiaceae bacterium]|nr:sorbosone dehydrogenase family protein [Burkholderiaceae bacterium]